MIYKNCPHHDKSRCPHPWWAGLQIAGQRQKINLEKWIGKPLRNRAEALKAFEQWKVARIAATRLPKQVETFPALVELYWSRHILGERLRDTYNGKYKLAVLTRRWDGAFPTKTDISAFRAERLAAGQKPSTINKYLALLRGMANWAIDQEILPASPWGRIKLIREDSKREIRVSPELEQQLLFHACNQDIRDAIVMALDTGLRRGEILSLEVRDVNLPDQLLLVRAENAKSKRHRIIPVSTSRLRELLLRRCAGKLPGDPVLAKPGKHVLLSFRTAWERTRNRAGAPGLRFHDLRGECASRLIGHNVPVSHVRDILGHASIITTERYDRRLFAEIRRGMETLER